MLSLMAGVQPTKGQVNQVLDFQEMNGHVSCHTGGSDEMQHVWRELIKAATIIDSKLAYLCVIN